MSGCSASQACSRRRKGRARPLSLQSTPMHSTRRTDEFGCISEGRYKAVSTWFATTPQNAALRVPQDDLPAPEDAPAETGDRAHLMSLSGQGRHGFYRDAFFQQQVAIWLTIGHHPARPVERLLGIQPVVKQGAEHLKVSLRLHIAAHHAEAAQETDHYAATCRG